MASETIEFEFVANPARGIRGLDQFESAVDRLRTGVDSDAEAIERSLEGIGNSRVRTSFLDGFRRQMGGARDAAAGAATDIRTSLEDMIPPGPGGAIARITALLGPLQLGVAAFAAVAITGALAAARWADELSDTANNLGVTTTFLQQMRGAATAAGGSGEAFEKGLTKLNQVIGDAAQGNPAAVKSFATLGISVKDSSGNIKNAQTIMEESRNALAGITSDTERAALANELYGKGSKELAGFLKQTEAEYEASKAAMLEYGTASEESLKASSALTSAQELLGATAQAGIIDAFAPVAELLADLATAVVPILAVAFDALGVVIEIVVAAVRVVGEVLGIIIGVIIDVIKVVFDIIGAFNIFNATSVATGNGTLSMGQIFSGVMRVMQGTAAVMVGTVIGLFRGLAATIYNIVAGINNFVAGSFLGDKLGVKAIAVKSIAGEAKAGFQSGVSRVMGIGRGPSTRDTTAPDAQRGSGISQAKPTKAVKPKGGGAPKAPPKPKETDEEKATKKYNEAVEKLRESVAELSLTKEQDQLLDEFARAGLKRDITLTGERAEAIRNLVSQLQDGQKQKKLGEAIKEFNQDLADLKLTEEQLAVVEARRRAGIPEEAAEVAKLSAATQGLIVKLDGLALARFREAAAKRKADQDKATAKDIGKDQNQRGLEATNQARVLADPTAEFRIKLETIERQRVAEAERIRQLTSIGELERGIMLTKNEQIAAQETANAQTERQQAITGALSATLQGLWDDPLGAMKNFFAEFLKQIIVAIAKAIFLKATLPGGGSAGGLISSAILGAIGARADGGSVGRGGPYLIGERGPELFFPGRAGQVLSNKDSFGSGGGMNTTYAPVMNFHASGNAQQDAMSLSSLKMQQAQQAAQFRANQDKMRWR